MPAEWRGSQYTQTKIVNCKTYVLLKSEVVQLLMQSASLRVDGHHVCVRPTLDTFYRLLLELWFFH